MKTSRHNHLICLAVGCKSIVGTNDDGPHTNIVEENVKCEYILIGIMSQTEKERGFNSESVFGRNCFVMTNTYIKLSLIEN